MKPYEKIGLLIVLFALSIGTDTAIQDVARTLGLIIGGMIFTYERPSHGEN